MAKKIEALAEFYRQNGWEEAANVLEADAKKFREAGMPDDFRGKTPRRRKEQRTFTSLPVELKVRLIQILSDVQLPDDTTRNILQTDGLAERINQDVGRYMQPDTHLRELWLPARGSYEEYGDEFSNLGEFSIDKRIVQSFNSTLKTLVEWGIDTVGRARKNSLGYGAVTNAIGENRAQFIRQALAPMNNSQEIPRRH